MSSSTTTGIRSAKWVALAVALLAATLSGNSQAVAADQLGIDYTLAPPSGPKGPPAQRELDLYVPDGVTKKDRRPIVVWVHGGGWALGDKSNRIEDKVALFTGAGYLFASVNYRLSPDERPPAFDPGRVMFPDHPNDVGEAIGWLDRNAARYGGDPKRMVLLGHSAGAHLVALVSTDPRYAERHGVEQWQIAGAVSLDTDAFDIEANANPARAPGNPGIFWNAFGTPAEAAASDSWTRGSPLHFAGPRDPRMLLVTGGNPRRQEDNRTMATALGQDPSDVFVTPYDHEGMNLAVGSDDDPAGETSAIMSFYSKALAAAKDPRARLRRRPPRVVRTGSRTARVRFKLASNVRGATFKCRLGSGTLKRCSSSRRFVLPPGKHTFRYRAIAPTGRPGPVRAFRFRIES